MNIETKKTFIYQILEQIFYVILFIFIFASLTYTGLTLTHLIWKKLPQSTPLRLLDNTSRTYQATATSNAAGELVKRRMIMPLVDQAIQRVTSNPLRVMPFIGSAIVTAIPPLQPVGNLCNAVGRFFKSSDQNRPINQSTLEQQAEQITTSIHTVENLPLPNQAEGIKHEWIYAGNNIDKLVTKIKPEQFDYKNLILFIILFIIITTSLSYASVRVIQKITQYKLKPTTKKILKKSTRKPSSEVEIKKPTFSYLNKIRNRSKQEQSKP